MDITGLGSLFDFGSKILERIFPNPADRLAAQTKLAELQQTGELAQLAAETDLAKGQLEINKVEAGSENIFVSGWRPFMGWVCGAAFAYKFTLQPFLIFIVTASGSTFDPKILPVLDWSEMLPVVIGLLGLGTMRTTEKIKGVA